MIRKPTANNFVYDVNAIATAKLNQEIAVANTQKNALLDIISKYLTQQATREDTQTYLEDLSKTVSGLS
jgi:hypothetical protein